MVGAWWLRSLLLVQERVEYRQPLYLLSVLQVLAVEPGAARLEGGGNDEGIIEGETVAALEGDCALVQWRCWIHLPKGEKDIIHQDSKPVDRRP